MFPSTQSAADWLAGVIDGEGCVSMSDIKGTRGARRDVRITNTDPDLLAACRVALDMLGVEHTTYDRSDRERLGTKPIFDLVISRKSNIERLASQVTLRSFKAAQLDAMLSSWIRPGKPTREEMEAHLASGESDASLALRLGVTAPAVWYWRKSYGLPTRQSKKS